MQDFDITNMNTLLAVIRPTIPVHNGKQSVISQCDTNGIPFWYLGLLELLYEINTQIQLGFMKSDFFGKGFTRIYYI